MSQTQTADARVLHMSQGVQDGLGKALAWSYTQGIEMTQKLCEGLDYLRTYGRGPESDWKTTLLLDMGFNPEAPSFVGEVECIRPDGTTVHYMTIGMIYSVRDREWSFHS